MNNLASQSQRLAFAQCTAARHMHRLTAERIAADDRRSLWLESHTLAFDGIVIADWPVRESVEVRR